MPDLDVTRMYKYFTRERNEVCCCVCTWNWFCLWNARLKNLSQFVNVLDVRWSVRGILRDSTVVAWPHKGRELCIEKVSKNWGWHGIEWQQTCCGWVNEVCSAAHSSICLVPFHTFASDHCVSSLKYSLPVSCALLCALLCRNCWSHARTHWKAVSGTDLSVTDFRGCIYVCLLLKVQCRHPLFSPSPHPCRDGIMAQVL